MLIDPARCARTRNYERLSWNLNIQVSRNSFMLRAWELSLKKSISLSVSLTGRIQKIFQMDVQNIEWSLENFQDNWKNRKVSDRWFLYFSSLRIVVRIASYTKMAIGACPSLRDLKGQIVRMQLPLILLSFAHFVQRELLDAFFGTVAAQQHLDQLVHGGLLWD